MNPHDRDNFRNLLSGCLDEIYGKKVSSTAFEIWFATMREFPLDDLQAAFMRYMVDPADCKFPPKPGDIMRYLPRQVVANDHPGPDEAWGMLLQFITNETETGVLTEQMRQGWEACGPILKINDKIGARKCFIETYARLVTEARQNGIAPRWNVSLGSCEESRERRLQEAVRAGKITEEIARGLLPYNKPAHKQEPIAGLLEGPKTSEEAARRLKTRERIDAIIAKINATSNTHEEERLAAIKRDNDELEALKQAGLESFYAKYPETQLAMKGMTTIFTRPRHAPEVVYEDPEELLRHTKRLPMPSEDSTEAKEEVQSVLALT